MACQLLTSQQHAIAGSIRERPGVFGSTEARS